MNRREQQVPRAMLNRVRWALAAIREWNAAIRHAHDMERLSGCPGRYEWELRFAPEHAGRRDALMQWMAKLATFDALAGMYGIDPQAIYAELGGLEALLAEGPRVRSFRPIPEKEQL